MIKHLPILLPPFNDKYINKHKYIHLSVLMFINKTKKTGDILYLFFKS